MFSPQRYGKMNNKSIYSLAFCALKPNTTYNSPKEAFLLLSFRKQNTPQTFFLSVVPHLLMRFVSARLPVIPY